MARASSQSLVAGLALLAMLAVSVQGQLLMNRAEGAGEVLRALENLAKCRQSTGATEEDVRQMIETRQVPTSRAGKCLIACMGQMYGVVENGRFSPDAALRLVDSMMQRHNRQDPQLRAEIQSAIYTCSSLAVSEDQCEAAATLSECGLEQARRIIPMVRQRHANFNSNASPNPNSIRTQRTLG